MTRSNRIPRDPRNGTLLGSRPALTLAEVNANSYLTQQVREQCARILGDLDRYGEVWWTGSGYHRTLVQIRDFAFRVLLAKLRIVRTDDRRRFEIAS